MDQLEVKINFTVILMIREEEPDDWFDEIIKVMADVVDTVLTDQTLDGSVFDCTPTGFAPGNIRFVNRVFYGGAVTFEADMHFEH
jgi:hypothetical protein